MSCPRVLPSVVVRCSRPGKRRKFEKRSYRANDWEVIRKKFEAVCGYGWTTARTEGSAQRRHLLDKRSIFFGWRECWFVFDYSRGGAAGNKLKMSLGLPVYVWMNPWIPSTIFRSDQNLPCRTSSTLSRSLRPSAPSSQTHESQCTNWKNWREQTR